MVIVYCIFFGDDGDYFFKFSVDDIIDVVYDLVMLDSVMIV